MAAEVIEATEFVEAVEVIEAIEVLDASKITQYLNYKLSFSPKRYKEAKNVEKKFESTFTFDTFILFFPQKKFACLQIGP